VTSRITASAHLGLSVVTGGDVNQDGHTQ